MGMKYRLCGDVVLWIRCGKVESLFVMFLNIYSRYFFRERVFYILKGKIEIFFFSYLSCYSSIFLNTQK